MGFTGIHLSFRKKKIVVGIMGSCFEGEKDVRCGRHHWHPSLFVKGKMMFVVESTDARKHQENPATRAGRV